MKHTTETSQQNLEEKSVINPSVDSKAQKNISNGPPIHFKKIGDSQFAVANSKMDQQNFAKNNFRDEPSRIQINQQLDPERVGQPNTTIPFTESKNLEAPKVSIQEKKSPNSSDEVQKPISAIISIKTSHQNHAAVNRDSPNINLSAKSAIEVKKHDISTTNYGTEHNANQSVFKNHLRKASLVIDDDSEED